VFGVWGIEKIQGAGFELKNLGFLPKYQPLNHKHQTLNPNSYPEGAGFELRG